MRVDVHFAVKVTHVVCVPGVICLVKLFVKNPTDASNGFKIFLVCLTKKLPAKKFKTSNLAGLV